MRFLRGFFQFWYDFIIGDDWLIAAGVVGILGIAAGMSALDFSGWLLLPVAIAGLLGLSAWRATLR